MRITLILETISLSVDFGGVNISSALLFDEHIISLQTAQFGEFNIFDVFFILEAANVLQELQVCISVLSKIDLKTQNYETVAMLMSQTNSVGVEFFSPVNTFYCSNRVAT